MKIEVEVISKEIIAPSSPTLTYLRHYQLSSIDQVCPPIYNPLVLFYDFNGKQAPNITDVANHLKKSLADVLTLFYPLAGRIKPDGISVDCNDEGIPFLEAHVSCKLADFLNDPTVDEISKFMPFELDDHLSKEYFALAGVQLTIFACGGFAIGQCISHKITDASSYFMFSTSWAAKACGVSNVKHPDLVSGKRFPPKEVELDDSRYNITKNKVTKRFIFTASKIKALKAKYIENVEEENDQKPPSRIDALTSFIWSRFVINNTINVAKPRERLYIPGYAVNLRPRFNPPLPQHCFGNIIRVAFTGPMLSSGEACTKYGSAMKEVREEINKIENECGKGLQEGAEESGIPTNENSDKLTELEVVPLVFSSYCRFPVYDNDFGWGRPAWVFSSPLRNKNAITFMDTKEGDGIEAFLSLDELGMARFENDTEFLAYVSPNICSQKDDRSIRMD